MKAYLIFVTSTISGACGEKNLSCGEIFPYDRLSYGEVSPHEKCEENLSHRESSPHDEF